MGIRYGSFIKGFVIVQVQSVVTYSSLFKKEMEYQTLTRITAHIVEEYKHWRQARVLAYIDDNNKVSSGYKRVRLGYQLYEPCSR